MTPSRFVPRPVPVAALAAAALLLVLNPGPARAVQGISLAWDHCFGDGAATPNATFACNTNVGLHVLVGSFTLADPYPGVGSMEIVLDLASASAVLPAWWEFRDAGNCRSSGAGASFLVDPVETVCLDWSGGNAIGGLAGYCTSNNPPPIGCGVPGQPTNTARMKLVEAVALGQQQDLLANQSYFSFAVRINHQKTVGPTACGGCTIPVCIVLNSINVVKLTTGGPGDHRFLSAPVAPGSNFVAWQGGAGVSVGSQIGCPAATPAQRSTWGSVKALYR